jgi:hypothetical protein
MLFPSKPLFVSDFTSAMVYGGAVMTTREGMEEETMKKLKEESTCLILDKRHSFFMTCRG